MSNDQDRIAQLEAACALKDKVINDVRFFLQDYLKSVTHPGVSRLVGDCYDATTTSAGKDLLDRLQKAEGELAKCDAQAAATRDALLTLLEYTSGTIPLTATIHDNVTAAINTTAGAALLDRLKKAEGDVAEMQAKLGKLKSEQDRLQAMEAERDRYKAAFQPVIDWMRSINTPDVSEFLGQLTALEMRKQLANLEALQPAQREQ